LDEQGKTFYVVLATGAAAPSALHVKNGQDGTGAILAANFRGTINVTTASTEFSNPVSGLQPNTAYDVYFVSEDNVPNLQTTVVKISVTTGTLFTEDFNGCDGTASFTSFSTSGSQVWSCSDFGRGGTKGIRMNGFSGTALVNEDWLISPPVTLSTNASLSFHSQFSFTGNGLQLKISTNYSGNGDPATATWTDLNGNFPTVAVPSNSSSLADWTLSSVDLSAFSGQNVHVAFIYTSTTTAAARWTLDEITFNNGVARYLQISPTGLAFTAGNTVKSYAIKGFNLTNDITISAPPDFQVSKDNVAFSSSISFSASELTASTNVYVRFNLSSPSTNTSTGNITHTSAGVSQKNVLVTGTDKSLTLDVVTWNVEWFSITSDQGGAGVWPGAGASARTSAQVALQRANVAAVIKSIDADIYCLQEVGNENANFDGLVSDLGAGWAGIRSLTPTVPSSSYGSDGDKVQRLAIIYKTSVVNPVATRSMLATVNTAGLVNYPSTNNRFWASGRFPFLMTANVTVGGVTKQIDFINLHARANGGSTAADQKNRYDMRRYDVEYLKDSIDARMPSRNIVLLGDFNDDVKSTVVAAAGTTESSYKKYVDDNLNYNVLTMPLSQANAASFIGSSLSMIDHLITSNEMTADYLTSSTAIEDARTFIPNYVNTTSDHLPVSSRFVLVKMNQTITFNPLTTKTFGDAPFTVSASTSSGLAISFESSDPSIASVSGNTIAILKAGQVTITAKQAGDAGFNPASDVAQTLTINKADQQITFQSIPEKQLSDAPFTLSATATSGLPVSFVTLTTGKVTVNNAQVTILSGGRVIINATQPGNSNYNPAPLVSANFCVKPAKPTVNVSLASGLATLTSSLSGGYKWFL
ncbi:MAG: choice-of-anchor J domain-containing protein, partial [Flammeovirgaceae bacterium]